jgi:nitrite reductase/ring-hydroxylating ferredoxin subunit
MTAHPVPSRRVVLNGAGLAAITLCLGGCAAAPGSGSASGGTGPTTKIVGQFVVTQPKAGTYEAFGYLCTHQNLPVQQVTDAAIVCGRHGSTYSLADGSVLTGPAQKALTKATVKVEGDTLTIS